MSDRALPSRLADRLFWALFAVLTAATLVPLWSVRVPPMQDIWQHLALVDVLHHYDAPGSVYPDYFLLPRVPKPNMFYYYATHALGFLAPSLEIANKWMLSLYVVAFPAAFLYLLRAFDRSRWLVLFGFPFVYNAMFAYGFVSFLLATPMMFVAVGAYRRFALPDGESADTRAGVLAGAALLATFFTHAHVYLLANLLCGLLLLMHRGRGPWAVALRLAPFAPALAFFLPWFETYFIAGTASSAGRSFGTLERLFGPTFYRPGEILTNFFFHLGDYFRGQRDDFLFLALVMTALALLATRRAPEPPPGDPRRVRWWDLEVLTFVLALSCLVLPQHIEAQSVISMRHVVFAFLFFFGWLDVDRAPRRLAVVALAFVTILHGVGIYNLVKGFRSFEKEMDGYPALFERADGGKRLLKALYNQESRVVHHGAFWHMHFFYTLQKGGISDLQFAEYPHNPIQYRPGMVPPQVGAEFHKNPAWRFYDYVLVRKSSSPPLKPVEERLETLAENEDWTLFRVTESPVPRPPDAEPLANTRRADLLSEGGHNASPVESGVRHVSPIQRSGTRAVPGPDLLRRRIEHPPLRPAPR